MRSKTAVAAVLAFVFLLAVAQVPGAGAKTRREHLSASVGTEVSLRGTAGYEIGLSDTGKGAFLNAVRSPKIGSGVRDFIFEDAVYYIPSSMSATDADERLLDVKIGRLGHFRGHLKVASTETEPNERGCTGKPTIVESGVFLGAFRFRGEAGYTQVRASRAEGSITRTFPQECKVTVPRFLRGLNRRHGHAAKRPAGNYKLLASDARGTFFQAERRDERGVDSAFSDFSASVSGRLGHLEVSHSIGLPGLPEEGSSPFTIPSLADPLSEAILAPPVPFSGSATFRSDGLKSGSWSGDLAVRLPGLPKTPLTGDGIEAGLCVGRAGCTETLPPALQPTLEAPPGVIVVVGTKRR